jgi:hypothetical protein
MEIFVIVNNFSRVFFDVFPHVKVIDLDHQSAYDIGKMSDHDLKRVRDVQYV